MIKYYIKLVSIPLMGILLLSTCDEPKEEIDTIPPTQIELYPVIYQDSSFILIWSPSSDDDFYSYSLYESFLEDLTDKSIVFETSDRNDTSYTITGINWNEIRYYRLTVVDYYGNETESSIISGTSYPKIVFQSSRNIDRLSIYIMNNDGGNKIELTTTIDGRNPEFSPDGSKIVFESYSSIYIMEPDGSNLVKLGNIGTKPIFSRDGSKILFYSYEDDSSGEIHIMNVDGSGQTRLTYDDTYNGEYDLSPDGLHIVFLSRRDGNNEIYIMNSDGNNQTRLTATPNIYCREPQFSPDGSKIVYRGVSGSSNIFVMNTDGSNQTQLTTSGDNDHPRYSPNGSRIVFVSSRTGDGEIYIMNSDGSGQINLTNAIGGDWYPRFSSDGEQIVFYSTRVGQDEVYIINSNGSGQSRLTFKEGSNPIFKPR